MMNQRSRSTPADALRWPKRVGGIAAAFSLFALYLAWHTSTGLDPSPEDESPITLAAAEGPASGASEADDEDAPQGDTAGAALVKRGEYLARVGDCASCHTADESRPFAGGVPISTPFGTIYTPNITPDPDTGIGRWTDAEFVRAMHEGIGKRGEYLYPAFPYTEYTRVTQQDVLAIRAYLNTIAPIHHTPARNELRFPFNLRWLMVFWNWLNFDEGRFVPDPKQSAQWNRGAYLVLGLAHCEECHTPRNLTQGLESSSRFSGATVAGWRAFNITPDKTSGIGTWRDTELAQYLSMGVAAGRAHAAGPMAQVVTNSTQYLSDEDVRSIGVYLRALPLVAGGQALARDHAGTPAYDDVTRLRGVRVTSVNGAQLFVANCASCHDWSGQGVGASAPGGYPSLIHNSTVGASDASNLTLVILQGVRRTTRQTEVRMPEFASQLSDDQVAAISNYVTERFGDPRATMTVDQVAKLRAQRPS
jgi:mono/diheme cytochrome c family protein